MIVEDPDDLDLRRQREQDREEVRRLKAEIASQQAAGGATLPDRKTIAATTTRFLASITENGPSAGARPWPK